MKVDLKHTQIISRSDGIVEIIGSNTDYTVDNIKDANEALNQLFEGEKKLLLIQADDFSNIDKDAREYMASTESTRYALAQAFVIKSLGQKILANFYVKVNKPEVPVKIFNSKILAEKWLLELK